MNAFEKIIGDTFPAYLKAGIAKLFFLYPPMRPAGMLGKMPCNVQVGKAPYDVAGYYFDTAGTALGVELKETRDHENRLPIVPPGKKGNGLQYHQLEGLAALHQAGGVAALVWSNGGEVGRVDGQTLLQIKIAYDASLKAEGAGKEVAKGARSISWERFEKVKDDGTPQWLPPSPAPCLRKKGAA